MEAKRYFIILVGLISFVVAAYRIILYGSIIRSCRYTEKEIPISESFAQGKIRFFKFAYIGEGLGEQPCLPILGSIEKHIIHPVDGAYYQSKGLRLMDVGVNTEIELQPIKAISVTEHGLQIGGRYGPLLYLVAKDQKNNLYQIQQYSLGLDNKHFLKFVLNGESQTLTPDTIRNVQTFQFHPDKKDPGFQYTREQDQEILKIDHKEMAIMRKNCEVNESQGDKGCCSKSLEIMMKNNYPPFRGRCPVGFVKKANPCFTSLTWCQPL